MARGFAFAALTAPAPVAGQAAGPALAGPALNDPCHRLQSDVPDITSLLLIGPAG